MCKNPGNVEYSVFLPNGFPYSGAINHGGNIMNTSTQRTFGSPRSGLMVIIAILTTSWTACSANAANADANRTTVEVKAFASAATAGTKAVAQPTNRTAIQSPTESTPFQRGVLDDSVLAPWKRLLQSNDGTTAVA